MPEPHPRSKRLLGVDFTSAPRRAKPIMVAHGLAHRNTLVITGLEPLVDFAAFERLLARPGPWIGGFDFPFGLPAELVRDWRFPLDWRRLVVRCASLTRAQLRARLDAFRGARPAGSKYARRATDLPAGSHSPMKLVHPPVALMFHEGAPRLAAAGVHVPGLGAGDRRRVALEAYPGMLARAITRSSYKSDARAKQTPARAAARKAIVAALQAGAHPLGVQVACGCRGLFRRLVEDATGDSLDAVLCAVQAAWATARPHYGLPAVIPRPEGWIVSVAA